MLIIDGELQPKDKACIFANDKGLLLGFGLFETMRLDKGIIVALDKHWQRLEKSASLLELSLPLSFKDLCQAIKCLINYYGIDRAGIRLTVTAGEGERGLLANPLQCGHYILEHFDLPKQKLSNYRLCWSSILANPSDPLVSIKSLSYLTHAFVKREANRLGFDDALQLTYEGFVTETSTANLFMIKKGRLFTPALSDGVLPGITRARIIEYCALNRIECIERSIQKEEILKADEVFISNALMGVIPIASIEDKRFSSMSILMKSLTRSF